MTTDEGGKHVTALELRGRLPKLKGKPEKQQALVALLKRLRQLDLQAVLLVAVNPMGFEAMRIWLV